MCLALRDQAKIPTTGYVKDHLLEAGLGEKEISFSDLELDADTFKQEIYSTFPKLKDWGGFQFCKCKPNSRLLEPLSKLAHNYVSSNAAGNSRTYIRPLQKHLDMSITQSLPEGVII